MQQLTEPKHKGVFERDGKWWIRVPTGEPGKYRRESVGKSYDEAVALYQRRVGVSGPTLQDAMDSWLAANPYVNHSYRSHARYFQGAFPCVALSEFVRIENLRAWRDSHAREVKAATVNHRMAFLSNVFLKAIEDGLLEHNPIGGKGKNCLARLPLKNGRTRWLREEEEEKLKAVLLPRIWEAAEFAIHTGIRRGEQWALQWEDWDGADSIWVRPAKTDKGRRVYLNEFSRAVLEKRKAEGHPRPFPFRQPAGLSRTFNVKAKMVGMEDLTWHSLRHTSGTRMVRRGTNLRVVQRHLGHSSLAITERYTHVEDDQLIEAVEGLAVRESSSGPGRRAARG